MSILSFFIDFFKNIFLYVIQIEFIGYYVAAFVGISCFVLVFNYLRGKKE